MDAVREKQVNTLRSHYSYTLRNVLREIGGINNSPENREVMKQLDELLLEVGANGELLQELLVALRAPCPRVEQVEVGG